MNIEQLRFPIGIYESLEIFDKTSVTQNIQTIKEFPFEIEKLTQKLSVEQLQLTYRPQGWSVKQVVHHCADSHMNSFIRFKLALTEDNPIIKPYEEALWAELIDGNDDNINYSLKIIYAIHHKWVLLLNSLSKDDFHKTFFHPASKQTSTLYNTLGFYAWHCKHHLKHIEIAVS